MIASTLHFYQVYTRSDFVAVSNFLTELAISSMETISAAAHIFIHLVDADTFVQARVGLTVPQA